MYISNRFAVVQSLSCVQLFATPWTAACQASLSFTISQTLLTLMSIEFLMASNHLILCYSLLLPSGSFPMSRLFSSCGQSIEASASVISPPMNTQGLFPLRLIDLISLLSKGLLQYHSLKASIFSFFFL